MISSNLNSQDGLSSVIGVILMVALTILLSAVVGVYAFDLADQVLQEPPQAGVSFSEEYDQFYGMYVVEMVLNTAPNVDYVEIRGDVVTDSNSDCADALDDSDQTYKPQVGEVGSSAVVCVSSSGGVVRGVAVANDNEQVITTHTIED